MTRLSDFCRGLTGLALVLAVLAGIPTLLLVVVGFPLPTELPSMGRIRAHIEDGSIPDPFLIKTLALLVWLVWIQLAVALVAELVAVVRGRVAGRVPVLPAVQGLAGRLVTSTVLLAAAFTPSRSASAAPLVPVSAPVGAEPRPGTGPPVGSEAARSIAPTAAAVAGAATDPVTAERSGPPTTARDRVYATRSGDSWWALAERLLGDGMRWSELRSLNSGRTMLNGDVVTERTESVRGGWHLRVPADADTELLEAAPHGGGAGLARLLRPDTLVYEGPTGAGATGSGPGVAGVPYQVVAGDNLWDIAARHLGDPFRWPEIYERSTGLTQTFGRRITDPNLIWPESILSLPADALDVPGADPELVAEVLGRPPDSGPTAGTAAVGSAAEPVRPSDLDRIVERGADALGPTGSMPEGIGAGGGDERRSRVPPPVPGSAPDDRDPADPGRGGPAPGGRARSLVPALALGSGSLLAATGLVGLLRRARRLRLAEMGEGSVPAPPPMELVDIETVLRDGSDQRGSRDLWRALASLAAGVVRADEPVAAPEVVRLQPTRIEAVLLGSDARPPAPWRPVAIAGRETGDGGGFPPGRTVVAATLDELRPGEGGDLAGDSIPTDVPAPILVTVGGGLLVNLEAVGVLAIDGPPEAVAGLVRCVVTEVATGPARRVVDLRLSDRLPGGDLHPYGHCGPLAGLHRELESWLENAELALAATGASGPYALRAAGSPGALPGPVVVFADGTADDDLTALAPLVDRARCRRLPLAVVLAGTPDPDRRPIRPVMTAHIEDGRVRIDPHGFVAVARSLDLDLIIGAEVLIDHARRAPIVPRPVWPGEAGLADQVTDPAQVPTEETPEHEIDTELPVEEEEVTDRSDDRQVGLLIRVLGPVQVEGGPPALTDEQKSVLAFLALAGPSTTRQVRDAVWPAATDDSRAEEVLAGLGQALGHLLPTAGDGRHRLRSTVTDLGSARRWISRARALSGDRARNLLQLALSDVRGAPFSGVPERHWQWIEDHRLAVATQASSLLMDACFDLCDGAFEADDLHLAHWACEVATLLDPLHETVATRRVQLLRLLDEPDEARRVLARWEELFAATAGRPAPRGPRRALEREEVAPHVG